MASGLGEPHRDVGGLERVMDHADQIAAMNAQL
jgi:hypothetical protein